MARTKTQTTRSRKRDLTVLGEQVATCPRCPVLVENRTQPVFGAGPLGASVMFVGEAPGQTEDRLGQPFVGNSGRKLNQLLEQAGIVREEVYITNVIKCRPPKNRKPLPAEILNCRPYLEQQIDLVQPGLLCALGGVAAQWLVGKNQSLSRLRGTVHDYRGVPFVCTYHPSYLFRDPSAEEKTLEDLRLVVEQLKTRRK